MSSRAFGAISFLDCLDAKKNKDGRLFVNYENIRAHDTETVKFSKQIFDMNKKSREASEALGLYW